MLFAHILKPYAKKDKEKAAMGEAITTDLIFFSFNRYSLKKSNARGLIHKQHIESILHIHHELVFCHVCSVCTIHALDSQFSRVARGLLSPGTWVTCAF